jgi:predicted esterase
LVGTGASQASAADVPWKPIARRLPPAGNQIPAGDRAKLAQRTASVAAQLASFAESSDGQAQRNLLPDVEVYLKAVRFALDFDEFYKAADVDVAVGLLNEAEARLAKLRLGKTPWTTATGLAVRGYRSSIDGSPQPYGLEIPADLDLGRPAPLYVWLHGRGDQETDLRFIHNRDSRRGQMQPPGAIVLHPFGRQCIGWKSAGEVDVLDAIESVKDRYRIDPDRVSLLGFSMGGAGAWHIGAHYSDRFAVVHAGAGFAETAQYNRLEPKDFPPAYEQTLWGLYDVPSYARNLLNVPLVVYSGEQDRQIQAARVMEAALAEHGAKLNHIIGPGMGHKYDPASRDQVLNVVGEAVERGVDRHPRRVSLQTRTLRYSQMHWVRLHGLGRHWEDSRIDAERTDGSHITVRTHNVTEFSLSPPWPDREAFIAGVEIDVDGQMLQVSKASPSVRLQKTDRWRIVEPTSRGASGRKIPGLQGPIDDVLYEPFLVVTPSGKSAHPAVQRWVQFELAHFRERWRSVYRGDLRTKRDDQVTDADLRDYHLILWGDPTSNRLIARVNDQLPVRWSGENVQVGDKLYDAATHAPMAIYSNPLMPHRYVVLNSGPTHREAHDRTNSLQNPKLPDWAIVDVTTPPDAERPGRIVAADFFDERWKVRDPK